MQLWMEAGCKGVPNCVIGGLELSVTPPASCLGQGGEKGWRLNQLPAANELIKHAYVMTLRKNPKRQMGEL